MNKKIVFSLLLLFNITYLIHSQSIETSKTIKRVVIDKKNKETLIGANVEIINLTGMTTDVNGEFKFNNITTLPITIRCSYIGYKTKEIEISNFNYISIKLETNEEELQEVQIRDTRLTERLKQSPITIESLDINAIKETPASTFYEGLSNLKGVDLTSASLGFKIINTRGFNSTSPVRSLQLIDGIDNQSPGLNFSLGNFMGSPELDTKGVEIIVGANSALYGPNAFNGVIYMESKDPFRFPGTEYQIKIGERALVENSFRFARTFKDKSGNDKFGFKINLQHFKANDWEAENMSPSFESPSLGNNPGGYDAVNRYGDEWSTSFSDFYGKPGLGTIHRTGYLEKDLVDYDTKNLKFNSALHYKTNTNNEFIYSINYGEGTTVYQGDNRYSLKNIKFLQNRLEYRKKDKFFIRFYTTHEDAGDSYDAVATAVSLQERGLQNSEWATEYSNYWSSNIKPLIEDEMPGWESWDGNPESLGQWIIDMQSIIAENPELLNSYHEMAEDYANSQFSDIAGGIPYIQPGTEEFNNIFNEITNSSRYDSNTGNLLGGTRFFDKSSLYHLQGEYKHDINETTNITIGGNARLYTPNSEGSIFDDGFVQKINNIYLEDENGNLITDLLPVDTIIDFTTNPITVEIIYDTIPVIDYIDTLVTRKKITNFEYGIYAGIDKKLLNETLLINTTIRMDKNQNFDYLFSPAGSVVWKASEKDLLRFSFSSALRNPTLTDQYLNYDFGSGILLGNLNGFGYDQYFVDVDSLISYFRYVYNPESNTYSPDQSALREGRLFVAPIKPEKVKTLELGFRTTLWEKLYIDASYYYSIYRDFIGYQIGASYTTAGSTRVATEEDVEYGWATNAGDTIDNYFDILQPSIQGYRLAVNAKGRVKTQGFSIGMNYFLPKSYTLNFNYSWNKLINEDEKDPIIPAYNTPEHKFNLGLSGQVSNLFNFQINYKWIDGFLFEGSPQFTGYVESYGLLDFQMNKDINIKNIPIMVKLGASNVLNNEVYQAYGGPKVGRLSYLALLFEFN